jgi:hypothetical protein
MWLLVLHGFVEIEDNALWVSIPILAFFDFYGFLFNNLFNSGKPLNTILDFNSTLEFSPLVDEVHKNFFLS